MSLAAFWIRELPDLAFRSRLDLSVPICAAMCLSRRLWREALLFGRLFVFVTMVLFTSLEQVPVRTACTAETRELRDELIDTPEFRLRDVERVWPVEDSLMGMLKVASVLNQGRLLS